MKVHWLIDADLFAGYREELVAAIRAQGHEVKLIQTPSPPFRWDDVGCSYRETFPAEACVLAHGDIELVTRIRNDRRWKPGAFCSIENFFWSNYAPHFGEYLLNRDYVMLPFGELADRQDLLFETHGRDGRIFVRPDSPLKLFTGQVAERATFAQDLEFMGFYEFPTSSPVVVSSPKQIVAEWRFVISNRQVVTGCQYRDGEHRDYRPGSEPGAQALAGEIAELGYAPDPIWIMDICRTVEGAYHLLEIGGFSFSDLYACDKTAVVAAASAAAIKAWNNRDETHCTPR